MAPRVPMKFREVVYTLSPYEQTIMNGLWKNLPHKAAHFAERARDAVIFAVLPIWAIGSYCENYKEKEKMHHRF
ncbi:hypothetical protein QBZ16_000347 [Prototheca wickerhamii]|uniref:Cytochrome b-c1 complex subunit 8 n=1 Tax=Prototheca wickerhamii TaxID=3111 RepID=A0AAD9IKZ7_PROWI|nr:hypothetical protein QBZ16_000347 [Prototheca wickerhamii]